MDDHNGYFTGKTAIVTGAASGIGLALTEELFGYGAGRIVMADIHPGRLDEHAARLFGLYPGRVKGLLCDVTNENDVNRMIHEAVDFFGGRLDLLINNAGAGFSGRFVEQSIDDWKKAFDLNFYGALYCIRAALPLMLDQGGGQVINVISGIAFYPMPYQTMYSATKSALSAMTISLRTEHWDDNIRFSAATPGTTKTAIWGHSQPPPGAQSPRQSAQAILAGAALNRRYIYGDQLDREGARTGFDPETADAADEYLLQVARHRRAGKTAV